MIIEFMLVPLLVAAMTAPAPDADLLRIGMDTRSRPWAFVPGLDYAADDFSKDPKLSPAQLEQLVGVDIDILQALAQKLGAKIKIVPVAWQGIERGLLDKRYDIIMNAWVPSSKTPEGIVASTPYYDWSLLVSVRADDKAIRAFADVAGKTVGHFADPSVDRSVSSLRPGRRVPFDDSDALFEALAAKKLDAAVEDSTYVRWRVAHDPAFRIVDEPLNKLGYHLGVRREDAPLLARLEAAIRGLLESGELPSIRKRWESAESPGR